MGFCLLGVSTVTFEPRGENLPGGDKRTAAAVAVQEYEQTWSHHLPGVLGFGQHWFRSDIPAGS